MTDEELFGYTVVEQPTEEELIEIIEKIKEAEKELMKEKNYG